MTQARLLRLIEFGEKRWTQSEQRELENVRVALPKRLNPLQLPATAAAAAPPSNAVQSSSERCPQQPLSQGMASGRVLSEATSLAEAVPRDERHVQSVCAPPLLGRVAVEREVRRWWGNALERVAARTADAREGRALHDRLVTALEQQPDADVAGLLAEQLAPLRQQLQQHLQEELRHRLASAGAREVREGLRCGVEQFEVLVDSTISEMQAAWTDEPMRQAMHRLHTAMDTASHAEVAAATAAATVREVLRPLTWPPPAEPEESAAAPPKVGALLARLRTATAPLAAAAQQLASSSDELHEELARLSELP